MMRNYSEPPASQGPEVAEGLLRDASIMATLPDMTTARTAMEELGRAGVEGQHVTLRGPGADVAVDPATEARRSDTASVDSAIMGRWFRRVAYGAAFGAVVGAILGIPVGLLAIWAYGEEITVATIIASAFFGALFLSTIFGLIAHVYQLPGQPQAWELTFHESAEPVIVGVHTQEARDVEAARRVFEGLGASDIREVRAGESARETVDSMAHEQTR